MSVNQVKLAKDLLRWRELQEELSGLEYNIKEAVSFMGESITVGGVYAKYSKGRTTYDYISAVKKAMSNNKSAVSMAVQRALIVDNLDKKVFTKIAKDHELQVSYTVGEPTVSISIMGSEEEDK